MKMSVLLTDIGASIGCELFYYARFPAHIVVGQIFYLKFGKSAISFLHLVKLFFEQHGKKKLYTKFTLTCGYIKHEYRIKMNRTMFNSLRLASTILPEAGYIYGWNVSEKKIEFRWHISIRACMLV